jgi:hypothetical protein
MNFVAIIFLLSVNATMTFADYKEAIHFEKMFAVPLEIKNIDIQTVEQPGDSQDIKDLRAYLKDARDVYYNDRNTVINQHFPWIETEKKIKALHEKMSLIDKKNYVKMAFYNTKLALLQARCNALEPDNSEHGKLKKQVGQAAVTYTLAVNKTKLDEKSKMLREALAEKYTVVGKSASK